jgi:hypothetical protein
VNFPLGAMARLGLARAYAIQGDSAKARATYEDFLAIWKNADSGIPILVAAKIRIREAVMIPDEPCAVANSGWLNGRTRVLTSDKLQYRTSSQVNL